MAGTLNYVGNPDFRGYLNYLGQNGDGMASSALSGAINNGMGLVNNQGAVASDALIGQLLGGNTAADTASDVSNFKNYINNAYSTYQGLTGAGGGAASSGAAAPNPGLISELQGQLNNLDPQQAVGLQNIGNSYNQSANRLDEQNAAAQRNYKTQTDQNLQGYQNNRNNIIQGTQAQANALQRLLGLNGAGNSSAAYEQAPYAAALAGSQQLNGAQQTFGNNGINLDTAWGDTQRNYKNSQDDLNNQRYQQENALRSSIAQTKATLLDRIAQAQNNPGGAATDVNSLLSQITQLGQQYANPVLRTPDIAFNAPNLSDYVLKNTGSAPGATAPVAGGGAQSDVSPTFLGLLAGQQRDQFGNIIQA